MSATPPLSRPAQDSFQVSTEAVTESLKNEEAQLSRGDGESPMAVTQSRSSALESFHSKEPDSVVAVSKLDYEPTAEVVAPPENLDMDSRPWTSMYSESVKAAVEQYKTLDEYVNSLNLESLLDCWNEIASRSPDQVAFRGGDADHNVTFGMLAKQSSALAAYFQDLMQQPNSTLKVGDNIMVVMPSCPQMIVTGIAAMKAGLSVSFPVPSTDEVALTHQLEHQIENTEPKIIVASKVPAMAKAVTSALRRIADKEEGDRTEYSNFVKERKVTRFESGIWDCVKVRRNAQSLKEFVAPLPFIKKLEHTKGAKNLGDFLHANRTLANPAIPQKDDPAVILFSSGTTGKSKAIVLTHRNLLGTAAHLSLWLKAEARGMPNHPKIHFALPLSHAFGCGVGFALTPMIGAETTLTLNPRDPKMLRASLAQGPYDIIFGVDKLYNGMINLAEDALKAQYADNPPAYLLSGASKTVQSTKDRVLKVFGTPLIEGYGSTESSVCMAIQCIKLGDNRYLPLPWADIRVVPKSKFKLLDEGFDPNAVSSTVGEEGELIYSCNLAKEYLNDPKKTAETFITSKDGRRWLRTGDLCRLNKDGTFNIVGRMKETIIINGENLSPDDIANTLVGAPNVNSAFVFRMPKSLQDQSGDDCVVVLVQGNNIDKVEVLDQMKSKGASQQQRPREDNLLVFDDSVTFPSTTTMKERRVEMTNMCISLLMEKEIKQKFTGEQLQKVVTEILKDNSSFV
ncbi:long-chain fatty acid--CoA ligase [Parashewanella curva]|uniref:Long-chain fatty acid--CoA ligase n=1 Tax=Parashewanella curva TaxID=2338552 RepID=A0A3L8PTI9_9GAMM|nr:class I adenylate-forming enzyme family protein [Parashewanella curva]RLV58129.1 long-chain fatty acid--CoA ligase [Parashewanella curva]